MWPLGKPAKLLRLLSSLAFYNDKDIDYARHSPTQVEVERATDLAKVKELVAAIGPDYLPADFLQAVQSGEVETDLTGQYIDLLRDHFRSHRSAP